jgi:hypothetical protein
MPFVERDCLTCGEHVNAWEYPNRTPRRYCSQQCWLKRHNNPERNAKVSRDTAKKRGDMQRDRGDGLTYRKRGGGHEHRRVMEEKLGRPLLSSELVHHQDDDKRNNDPDNLEVKSRSQHTREHSLRWHQARRERGEAWNPNPGGI